MVMRRFVPTEAPVHAVATVRTWNITEPPVAPEEGWLVAPERMWWSGGPERGHLAYRAGDSYPPGDAPLLTGETEWMRLLRQSPPVSTARRGSKSG